jgi:phosphoglycerate kinase
VKPPLESPLGEEVPTVAKVSVRDLSVESKKVLMRVDFNVPLDEKGRVSDDTRIRAALPTIEYILGQKAKLVLISHLGRPKGKVKKELGLRPVAARLGELLGADVSFVEECIGSEVEARVGQLEPGECLLLENLRFHPEEEANDPGFAEKLARLGDVYVNDAFGTAHRAHASTAAVPERFAIRAAGLLMEKELDYLGRAVRNPERPYAAIMGGAKISGKIDVIRNLIGLVDSIIVGGGMVYTFFKAQGLEIGESESLELAGELLDEMEGGKVRFLLPIDCVVADEFAADASARTVSRYAIPEGWRGLDIGPGTVELFTRALKDAKTILWNGPMGVFEFDRFMEGTRAIAAVVAERTAAGATTIVGGGDTVAAIAKLGLTGKFSHISTGGGAALEYLAGRELPGVAVLSDRKDSR